MPAELSVMWWGLLLLGLAAGLLSGTLGLGSGTLLVPVLVLLFAFPQKSAQGTALAVMVPMALLGAFRYWKNPEIQINPTVVGLIVGGALVGVLIGSELSARLPAAALRKVFAAFIIVLAVRMFLPARQGPTPAEGRTGVASPVQNPLQNQEVSNEQGRNQDG